ncbi:hypothetical protein [Spirosoma pomorum]
MAIWRITGLVLLAGLALFLVSLLIKLLLVALAVGLIVRIAGGFIADRFFGSRFQSQGRWQQPQIISIDNPTPTYQAIPVKAVYGRVIPIS